MPAPTAPVPPPEAAPHGGDAIPPGPGPIEDRGHRGAESQHNAISPFGRVRVDSLPPLIGLTPTSPPTTNVDEVGPILPPPTRAKSGLATSEALLARALLSANEQIDGSPSTSPVEISETADRADSLPPNGAERPQTVVLATGQDPHPMAQGLTPTRTPVVTQGVTGTRTPVVAQGATGTRTPTPVVTQGVTGTPTPVVAPGAPAVPREVGDTAAAEDGVRPLEPPHALEGAPVTRSAAPPDPAPPAMDTSGPRRAQAPATAPRQFVRSEGVGDTPSASPPEGRGAESPRVPEAQEMPLEPQPAADMLEAHGSARRPRQISPRLVDPVLVRELTARSASPETSVKPERPTGDAPVVVAPVRPQPPTREDALPRWDGRISPELQEEGRARQSRAGDGDVTPRDTSLVAHEARPLSARPQPATSAPVGARDDTPGPAFRGNLLLDQIADGVARARQLSRLVIELRPPHLGSLEIAVESRDGRLQAHFQATHLVVGSWLEENRAGLRSHLAESGLVFEQFTFSSSSGRYHGGADGDGAMNPETGPSESGGEGSRLPTPAPAASGILGARLMDKFA